MATTLVFNRASDNYLFHGSQFKAGSGRDFLRLSTANNEAIIDLCNNSNIDISATDVFINGNRVVTSSGTSGSTLGSLEVTGTTVLQDLSAGATDISSTLNVAGAVTFDSTLDISGAIYIQDNQKAEVTIDYGNGSIITQRSAALIVEGGVIVKAPPTSSDAPATNPRIYSFISEGEGFFRGGLECENGITLFSGDIAHYGHGTIYEASSNTIGNPTFDINAKNIDICGTLNVRDAVTLSSTLYVTGATTVSTFESTGATSLAKDGGIVNIAKSGVMTTIKGTLNVDEAVTLDSTLQIGSGLKGGKIYSTITDHELVIDPFGLDNNSESLQDASGVVTILGDLIVKGNTTTFHSINVDISDHLLKIASGSTTAGQTNGAGIEVGDGYATFTYNSTGSGSWSSNIGLDVTGDTSVSTFDSTGATSLATGGGEVNIASSGVMTTVKGTLKVFEAVTLDNTLTISNNLTTSNNTAEIPVTFSTFTREIGNSIQTQDLSALGGIDTTTYQDATNWSISRTVLSGHSYIKMEFKANFISSPEFDQTLSFRVVRSLNGGAFDEASPVFEDTEIGSNMGVTIRGVYNGTYIDDLAGGLNAGQTVAYKLQVKRNKASGDTIQTAFGIVPGGNYMFLQELYQPNA